MVAKGKKSRPQSPCMNVTVELDNGALKAKNNRLIQAVAQLQIDNANLIKQRTLLQEENFDINAKYNNLKNVLSIIDSTIKSLLPKLNGVIESVTGVIQLCCVGANIDSHHHSSPLNKDSRTQAVKPQIVNGHILHNPTITLPRLTSDNLFGTAPRRSDADVPSTSRNVDESRNRYMNGDRDEQNSDSDIGYDENENGQQDLPFVCKTSRRSRTQSTNNIDMSMRRHSQDFEDSDENEEAVEEEQEEVDEEQSDQRLSTIHEMEEENQLRSSISPGSRRRFVQGSLQEVRIYLNQLSNTNPEHFRGSGNISISVSPPERRSSFKHRSSSLVGNADESGIDNSSRNAHGDMSYRKKPRRREVTLHFNNSESSSSSNDVSDQYRKSTSSVRDPQTSSASSGTLLAENTLQGLDFLHSQLENKTSTPLVSRLSDGTIFDRSDLYGSPNLSKSDRSRRSENDKSVKSNITKRTAGRKDKRRVAQVVLNRLSLEKRLSGSPVKVIEDMVNLPPLTKSSDLKRQHKTASKDRNANSSNSSPEKNLGSKGKGNRSAKRKNDSPRKNVGDLLLKPKLKTSPTKNRTSRPKRAARPNNLKEANLIKKLRRSK